MKKLLLILLLLPLLGGVRAEALLDEAKDDYGASAVREALPEELQELGGELRFDGGYDSGGAFERLWRRLLELLTQRLREAGRDAVALIGVTLLCAMGVSLCSGQKQADYVQIAACAALAALVSGGVTSLIGEAFAALTQLDDYARASLPAVYTAAAASGAVASASARYAASCLALDFMMSASQKLILPLITAFLAMAICASVFENSFLRGAIKLCKKAALLMMTALTLAFTGFLSVTGLVTGSADAAAIKATKTVISSVLPVVGGILSDAASSVLAAAGVVRSTAGAFGLVAVCGFCLSPFAALAVKRWLFLAASAAAEMTAGDRVARLLGDLSAAMGMLIGLVGAYGFMLFFSFTSAMKAVTA